MLQNGVEKIVLSQNEAELNKSDVVDCQLSNRMKTIMKFVLNFRAKGFNILTSALIHGGEKLGWTMKILLEFFQHLLTMYIWSLSENLASIQFKCRLVGLLLK
jgi:hypothetical protein